MTIENNNSKKSENKLKNIISIIKQRYKNLKIKNLFIITNSNGTKKNIFSISFVVIYNFIVTKIFRKNIQTSEEQFFFQKHNKVKSFLAIISSSILCLILVLFIKLTIPQKESYGEYIPVFEENKQQKTVESQEKEKEKNIVIERVSTAALDEEIAAQSSQKPISYSFNVDREITTKEKIHTFSSANWTAMADILPENTKLKVNLMTSPSGYMMYKISEGEHSGKFITANNNLVNIDVNNDQLNTSFISKPIAIKILVNSNNYTDINTTSIKNLLYRNLVVNINGIGVAPNNKLIYYISDGSFIPVDNSKIIETAREVVKKTTDTTANNKSSTSTNKTTNNTKTNTRTNTNNRGTQNNTNR